MESQGQSSNYGAMNVGDSGTLDFDHLDNLPPPPQDSHHPLAGWYDTDL